MRMVHSNTDNFGGILAMSGTIPNQGAQCRHWLAAERPRFADYPSTRHTTMRLHRPGQRCEYNSKIIDRVRPRAGLLGTRMICTCTYTALSVNVNGKPIRQEMIDTVGAPLKDGHHERSVVVLVDDGGKQTRLKNENTLSRYRYGMLAWIAIALRPASLPRQHIPRSRH